MQYISSNGLELPFSYLVSVEKLSLQLQTLQQLHSVEIVVVVVVAVITVYHHQHIRKQKQPIPQTSHTQQSPKHILSNTV